MMLMLYFIKLSQINHNVAFIAQLVPVNKICFTRPQTITNNIIGLLGAKMGSSPHK